MTFDQMINIFSIATFGSTILLVIGYLFIKKSI